ncbi:MAG: enoyl-CoA hydratase [Chloroflexota bacterium]|nr:enoyl-CoA hydratase [Dehalococcoidia bacterium]MDW8253944.1 enoyl-CoA hydratase [Chloroflexota bacterium]
MNADALAATDEVLLAEDGPIATITLNRPAARNAMNRAMYRLLRALFEALNERADIRVVVLTGAGDKAFAAGADIAEFASLRTEADVLAYEQEVEGMLDALERLAKPVIAKIRGVATGGGCSLAAACDLRIAADDAQVGIPIARTLGNCLPLGNLSRLVDLIGPAHAKALLFTGRLLSAQEALAAGFLTEVTRPDDLDRRVDALARELAGHAPRTLQATKEGIRRLAAARRAVDGRDLLFFCYLSEDFREGVRAFLEKRRPVWTGR